MHTLTIFCVFPQTNESIFSEVKFRANCEEKKASPHSERDAEFTLARLHQLSMSQRVPVIPDGRENLPG